MPKERLKSIETEEGQGKRSPWSSGGFREITRAKGPEGSGDVFGSQVFSGDYHRDGVIRGVGHPGREPGKAGEVIGKQGHNNGS